MNLDQNNIDELIACPKTIIKKPTLWELERGHYRTDFELQSTDEQYFFTAFGRYNEMFNENFSFGLVYLPKQEKGSFELVRCNGPHGEHKEYPHHIFIIIYTKPQQRVLKLALKKTAQLK